MLCRVWFLLFAAALLLVAAEPVPEPVAEYRTRIEKPDDLATEILLAAQDYRPVANPDFERPLKAVALAAMRSPEELSKSLELASAMLRQQAEAATRARKDAQLEADTTARHVEAQLWARLAKLYLATGMPKEALEATRHQCEAQAAVATPEEWLEASLGLVRAFHRAGEADNATQLLELARKLTTKDGPLEKSDAAQARVKGCDAWVALRDNEMALTERVATARAAEQALTKALGAAAPETLACKAEMAGLQTEEERAVVETSQRELLEGREKALGATHPLTLNAAKGLGLFLLNQSDSDAAYPLLRRAYEGWMAGTGLTTEERLQLANRLAARERESGNDKAAGKIYEVLVEASTKLYGAEARSTLGFRNGLAITLSNRGDYAGAEKLSREILEVRRRVLGPADPDTLASLNNTAVYVRGLGRYREAEEMFRTSLAAREKIQGEAHREVLRTKANLAYLRFVLGDLAQAERLAQETLTAQQSALAADHSDISSGQLEFAQIQQLTGNLLGAEQSARAAVEGRERKNGEDDPQTISARAVLGDVLSAKGEHTKALELLYHALHQREARSGAEDPGTLVIARFLARALGEAGNFGEAETQLRAVLSVYTTRFGTDHPQTVEISGELGEILFLKGDASAGEPLMRRALEKGEEIYDAKHPFVAAMAFRLAELLQQKGETAAALSLAERASAIAKEKFPENRRLRERYDGLLGKLRAQQ